MIKLLLRIAFALTLFLPVTFRTAHAEGLRDRIKDAIKDAREELFDFGDEQHVILEFEEGSVEAEDEKEQIDELIKTAKEAEGYRGIKKAVVAVWSDKAYPRGDGEGLAEEDEAKQPNWLQRLLESNKAELEEALKARDIEEKNLGKIAAYLKNEGGPSRAVIMLALEK